MWQPLPESHVYVLAIRSGAGQRNLRIFSFRVFSVVPTDFLMVFQLWHTWILPWQSRILSYLSKVLAQYFPCQEQSRSCNFGRCDWLSFQILAGKSCYCGNRRDLLVGNGSGMSGLFKPLNLTAPGVSKPTLLQSPHSDGVFPGLVAGKPDVSSMG